MAAFNDGGWLELIGGSNNVTVRCKKVEFDVDDPSVVYIDYPDGNYGFSIDTRKRIVKIMEIWVTTNANFDTLITNLEALQVAGIFSLKVKRNSNNKYRTWNGINITMPVLWISMKGIGKVYDGDTEIWMVKMLQLRQAGALTGTN